MEMSPEVTKAYLDRAIKTFKSDRSNLSSREQRFLTKYYESLGKADRARQDIVNLKNQVTQAEAQIRSLELQAESAQGKALGLLEMMAEIQLKEIHDEKMKEADALAKETPKAVDKEDAKEIIKNATAGVSNKSKSNGKSSKKASKGRRKTNSKSAPASA
jgi:hypothetical protein